MQVDDIFGESAVTFGSPLADLSDLHETSIQIHRNVESHEVCSISNLDHVHLQMSKVVEGVEPLLDSIYRELENASKDSKVDFKQSTREESKGGLEHARLIPTYYSDEEDNESDDCYEDIEEIRR